MKAGRICLDNRRQRELPSANPHIDRHK